MEEHIPVLLQEVIEGLHLHSGNNVIDCTVGNGGHSKEILPRTEPNGKILGIDQNKNSLERAKKNLETFGSRVILVQGNFRELKKVIPNDFGPVRGILLDLGWSSSQLQEVPGLSFEHDTLLDMRLGESSLTAADILNTASEAELWHIIRLSDEPRWREIAHQIVVQRKKTPFERTGDLIAAVESVYKGHRGRLHPATLVFQAFRIAVNDELNALKDCLQEATELLAQGGRIAVISFHSLEDRIVKQVFSRSKELLVVTKRPIIAGEAELEKNPRSRSAKLRVAEKKYVPIS